MFFLGVTCVNSNPLVNLLVEMGYGNSFLLFIEVQYDFSNDHLSYLSGKNRFHSWRHEAFVPNSIQKIRNWNRKLSLKVQQGPSHIFERPHLSLTCSRKESLQTYTPWIQTQIYQSCKTQGSLLPNGSRSWLLAKNVSQNFSRTSLPPLFTENDLAIISKVKAEQFLKLVFINSTLNPPTDFSPHLFGPFYTL